MAGHEEIHCAQFPGSLVGPIFAGTPYANIQSAAFYTNVADTRTDGIELTGNYQLDLAQWGRLNLSSEANGQRLDLWVARQRCVDGMSGGVQHLSAELRLNGQVLRGCAYLGGARND